MPERCIIRSHSLEHGHGISATINELIESDALVCGKWMISMLRWINVGLIRLVKKVVKAVNIHMVALSIAVTGSGRGLTSLHESTYMKVSDPRNTKFRAKDAR